MSSSPNKRTKVFISYSHRDAEWLARLEVHLKPLTRSGEIAVWSDSQINPGSKWKEEILRAIDTSKVAILLVSADFLASDFISNNELSPLLAAASRGGATILPVIISPSRFSKTATLSDYQTVNDLARPLISLTRAEQEEVFVRVAENVEKSLSRLSPDSTLNHRSDASPEKDDATARSKVKEIIAQFPDIRPHPIE